MESCQKEQYIDDLPNYELLQGKNVVGIENPHSTLHGWRVVLSLHSKPTKSSNQKKKYMQIVDDVKKESMIDGLSVKNWETVLHLAKASFVLYAQTVLSRIAPSQIILSSDCWRLM